MSEFEQLKQCHVAVSAVCLLLLASLVSACSDEPAPSTTNHSVSVTVPALVDETLQRGLTFSHLQGEQALTGIHETLGGGACAFDYDRDGWTDLLLVNGSGLTRFYGRQHWWNLQRGHALFRNEGGRFHDVTAQAGLDVIDWGTGCATGDLDDDGDADVFFANYGPNRLFENNGDGTFTEITEAAGITGTAWSTGAAMADYDSDGHVDIYVTNYVDFDPGARTFEDRQQFRRDMPRAFDPTFFTSIPNTLYRNRGDGRFEDVTEESRTGDAGGRGLMAQWLDIDGDGRLDLLIANDAGSPIGLYVNADGHFLPAGERYRLNAAGGVRGINADDVNADGLLDLVIGTADGRPPLLLTQQQDAVDAERFVDTAWQRLARSRHAATGSNFGVVVEDFNADGRADLFLANGFTGADQDVPRLPQGQQSALLAGSGEQFSAPASYRDAGVHSARGAVVADFDNDGLPDVYVAHNNDIGRLLMNRTRNAGGHVSVELAGNAARGASVTVSADGLQRSRLYGQPSIFGAHSERVHFGIGNAESVRLQVRWADGGTDTFDEVAANRHYRINESGIEAVELPAGTRRPATFPLVIGERRPANRAAFTRWRLKKGNDEERVALFQAALADSTHEVRQAALETAAGMPHRRWLPGTLRALEHDDAETRIAALEALEQFEAESSVRWLLLRLEDDDPRIRERVATLFGNWFSEDEAVTQRKFLALPGLIRLLNDPDLAVRLAATRALGEAERYRALSSLVELLDDPSTSIRAATARAIGRIREREAIPALAARASDSVETPQVRAAAIIALQRLGAEDALGYMNEPGIDARERLETVIAILRDTDSTVISRRHLRDFLAILLAEIDFGTAQSELPGLFVDAACLTGGPGTGELLRQLLAQPSIDHAKAWRCLLELEPHLAAAHWKTLRAHENDRVRRAAFRYLLQSNIANRQMLLEASADPALENEALLARAKIGDENAALSLLDKMAEKEARLDIAKARDVLLSSGIGLPQASDFLAHETAGVRAVALRLWANGLPVFTNQAELPPQIESALHDPSPAPRNAAARILIGRQEAWAARRLQALLSTGSDIALQRFIVDHAHLRPGGSGVDLLAPVVRSPEHPLRRPALESLARIASPGAVNMLELLLADEDNSEDLRFAAARALWSKHPEDVLKTITAEGEGRNAPARPTAD